MNFIKKNFFEFSFDEDTEEEIQPDFDKFKSLSAKEQYYLASIYNWDDGAQVLKWIIESAYCDKGTATRIFWMTEPDYYFDYTSETIDEYERETFELLQMIIKRFKEGSFKTSKYKFLPEEEGYQTEWPNATGIWELPDELKKGNKGFKPLVIG